MQSLKIAFPTLTIVGEEEGTLLQPDDPVEIVQASKHHGDIDISKFPSDLLNIPADQLCAWVSIAISRTSSKISIYSD